MKINRLLEITMVLLNRDVVTARELADRFQVSTRTIYRDIDVLSVAGVPVFTNRGSGGGISLLENYALRKAYLTDHERDSIIFSLQTLQATEYPEIDVTLGKMRGLFRNADAGDWVDVEFSPWGSGPDQHNQFLDIKRAILECQVIRFDYVNASYAKTHRRVEPMRLSFKGRAWYLWGYCRLRQGFRVFRVSRMRKLAVENERFERKAAESMDSDAPPAQQFPLVTLRLRFQPEALSRLYDDYDDETIVENPDGTYEITVTFPEDQWVYGHILSFGASVEVLEPKHIRDIIRDRLATMVEIYDQ